MPSAMTSLSSTQKPKSAMEPMTPVKRRPTLSDRKCTVTRLRISRSASMATRSRRLMCSATLASLAARFSETGLPAKTFLSERWTTRSA